MAVHLDFETFSEADIRKTGAYFYARHPNTVVLMACYWLDGMDPAVDTPKVWLPWRDRMPADLHREARNGTIFKAHNAQFERAVWEWSLRRTNPEVPEVGLGRWVCTAAQAAASGLPRSLGPALVALGTKVAKNADGTAFIKRFCKPRKPTRADPRARILPTDDWEGFMKGVKYCQDDVMGEVELDNRLPPLTPREQRFYTLDMLMNERGLPIDLPLVRKTHRTLAVLEADIHAQVSAITGGVKATQVAKMLEVFKEMGLELENMRAQTVRDVLTAKGENIDPKTRRLLQLRVEAGKASTKKLASMLACTDPRLQIIQGGFLFHGAHTGRYAGRLVQPQNFIRGKLKPHQQDTVFELLETGDAELLQMMYEWPIDTISQCMRGFIKAPPGHRFVVVDYTAIEARVLAWVANERKVLRAYVAGVDVYKMMASSLFNVAIEDVDAEQRRLGKNLVLGCGYALGGARFVEYCAGLGQVVEESFAKRAVKMYREQHPNIVKSWALVEDAAATAIKKGITTHACMCEFYMREHWLCIKLPSGREIRYARARATPIERWGKPAMQISFQTDYHGKIVRESTYGGKLIENIVQGIARDVMREGMFAAEREGYPVHGTVHDELLTICPDGVGSARELEAIVCDLPDWTEGIPLGAEGFETVRYRKG